MTTSQVRDLPLGDFSPERVWCALSHCGTQIAVLDLSSNLHIFDLMSATKAHVAAFPNARHWREMVWSPDGKFIAASTAKSVHIFSLEENKILFGYANTATCIKGIVWSPDSRYLATVNHVLKIWVVGRKGIMRKLYNDRALARHFGLPHRAKVDEVVWPSNSILYAQVESFPDSNYMHIFTPCRLVQHNLLTQQSQSVQLPSACALYLCHGPKIVTRLYGGTPSQPCVMLRVWNVETVAGELLLRPESAQPALLSLSRHRRIFVSPCGTYVVGEDSGEVWRIHPPQLVARVADQCDYVHNISWSHNSARLCFRVVRPNDNHHTYILTLRKWSDRTHHMSASSHERRIVRLILCAQHRLAHAGLPIELWLVVLDLLFNSD